jgi:hypothetical protein
MTTYSSNKLADKYVTNREPFKGSNTWGEWIFNPNQGDGLYVVFSYGYHFPMYIWDELLGLWFANEDKYSRSTTRQQSQLRPNTPIIHYLKTNEMKDLISAGSVAEWTIAKAQRV